MAEIYKQTLVVEVETLRPVSDNQDLCGTIKAMLGPWCVSVEAQASNQKVV